MQRILIDFSWLYNKYYFVSLQKQETNLKDMLFSFLNRIPMNYPTSKIYVVLESSIKSTHSYSLNNSYKQNRNKELKAKVYRELREIVSYLSKKLPKNFIFVKGKGYEADYVIAFLSKTKESTLIFSGDKDMLQLTAYDNVSMSDKFECGRFVIKKDTDIFEKFKNAKGEDFTRISKDKRDILKYRVLKGDPSDNLPPVFPRIQDKDIKNIIQNYWTSYDAIDSDDIMNMIKDISESDEKLSKKLEENRGTWLINYEIMNLYNVDDIKISVLR